MVDSIERRYWLTEEHHSPGQTPLPPRRRHVSRPQLVAVEQHGVGEGAAHVHAQNGHDGNVSGRATVNLGPAGLPGTGGLDSEACAKDPRRGREAKDSMRFAVARPGVNGQRVNGQQASQAATACCVRFTLERGYARTGGGHGCDPSTRQLRRLLGRHRPRAARLRTDHAEPGDGEASLQPRRGDRRPLSLPARVYVYDGGNSRVLGLSHLGHIASGPDAGKSCTSDSDASGSSCVIDQERGADLVLGQPDFTHSGCNGDGNFQTFPGARGGERVDALHDAGRPGLGVGAGVQLARTDGRRPERHPWPTFPIFYDDPLRSATPSGALNDLARCRTPPRSTATTTSTSPISTATASSSNVDRSSDTEEEPMRKAGQGVILALLLGAVAVGTASSATQGVLHVSPQTVNFGTKPVGSSTFKGATIKNTSSSTVNLIVTVAREPDDFALVTLTTCPVFGPAPLAPGESCDAVMRFSPSEFFAGQDQLAQLQVQAADPTTGAVLETVLIGFTGRGK